MQHLPLLWLCVIFLASAVAIWIAGIQLSKTTDAMSDILHLGEALGGVVILAIVTNLPEIAITVSASLQGKTELAVGNLLGGIAIQTLVLVALDAFGLGKKTSLMNTATSLKPALEALLVVTVLSIVVVGRQLPASLIFLRVTSSTLLIFIAWLIGLYLISLANKGLPWKLAEDKGIPNSNQPDKATQAGQKKQASSVTVLIFSVSAIVTLLAGVALEKSGDALSDRIGMQGILFGATVLAAATSLPELSTGFASLKQKNYDLAIGDIFGGNSFLPVLFLVATICSGKAVLPTAKNSDIYLTALGMLMSLIYAWGILFKPKRQVLRMGIDSFVVLVVYLLGVVGLFVIAKESG